MSLAVYESRKTLDKANKGSKYEDEHQELPQDSWRTDWDSLIHQKKVSQSGLLEDECQASNAEISARAIESEKIQNEPASDKCKSEHSV